MLKIFDLTENDIQKIQQVKTITGAGSAREVVRRAIEEYHEKIFTQKSTSVEITPTTPKQKENQANE